MPIPLILAAAALVPPQSTGRDLISNDDYPKWALDRDKSAGVIYTAYVSPDGKIEKCQVHASRGDEDLAKAICPMVERRKMRPAIDSDGRPTYGVYNDVVNFVLSGDKGAQGLPIYRGPDAEFTLSQMPGRVSSPSDAHVVVEVGQDGRVSHCSPADKDAGPLAAFACQQLSGKLVGPMTLGSDQTVSYVQAMTVRLRKQA